MKMISKLLRRDAACTEDTTQKRYKYARKQHTKTLCKECSGSYYYDVVRCPVCSSSKLETIKMEATK
ncbi:MAG TPA: hypothetical protein VJI12_04155 [archaeon]|nr:hypothetical protein [archaeon]